MRVERKLARSVSRFLAQQRKRVMVHLQSPESLRLPQQNFWINERVLMHSAVVNVLQQAWLEGVRNTRTQIQADKKQSASAILERDPEMLEKAVIWASSQGITLAELVSTTTEEQLDVLLTNQYYPQIEEGASSELALAGLIGGMALIFGVSRAAGIAVNETTNAIVSGGRVAAEELRPTGKDYAEVWLTRQDSHVCKKCRPKHGVRRYTRGPGHWEIDPPRGSHLGCRCEIFYQEVPFKNPQIGVILERETIDHD